MSQENQTVKDLNKFLKNPRKISSSQKRILAKGLAKYGDLGGVVYNIRNQQLVGGNQRSDTLSPSAEIQIHERLEEPDSQGTVALGWIVEDGKKYNYREVDFSDADHMAACLLANKAGGDFDWNMVKEFGLELDTGGFDMEFTGFDPVEWENLLATVGAPTGEEARGQDMKERAEGYGAQGMSKIEVWVADEEYNNFVQALEKIMKDKNLETFSETVKFLVLKEIGELEKTVDASGEEVRSGEDYGLVET